MTLAVAWSAVDAPISIQSLKQILRRRRARANFFDPGLFADPAWDMLLELYACDLAHTRISVSSLCIAADVPGTTALRWITLLERRGLIQRRRDINDGRRVFIELSEAGLASMRGFFTAVEGANGML